MHYTGFFRRLIAMIIDVFIIIFLSLLLVFFLGMFIGGMLQASELIKGIGSYVMLINVLIFWLYYALQESGSKQATIGKRLMGIYVASESDLPLSFAQASIRHFSKYLSSILFIGFFMAAFTKKKQALHDIIAHALVLKKKTK